MGHPWPLFIYFCLSNKHYNFTANKCVQYMALGFEPTTFGALVSSHNQKTRAPAQEH